MTYQEAKAYVEESKKRGSVLGLSNMHALMNELGNPQNAIPTIHIAGTNGKGSVGAYLASICKEAGFTVGRYCSPAVFDELESWQYDDRFITEEEYAEVMTTVVEACDRISARIGEPFAPTYFELDTTLAFVYMAQKKPDVFLLETGMGGKEDATNVVEHPLACVFTKISMDHMQFLGESLTEIATQKAGIMKPGAWIFWGEQEPEVRDVLKENFNRVVREGEKMGLETVRGDVYTRCIEFIDCTPEKIEFSYLGIEYETSMTGLYQMQNATLAIAVFDAIWPKLLLGLQNDMEYWNANNESLVSWVDMEYACKVGVAKTYWPGRFEILGTNPFFAIDGAHNEDAVRQLSITIENRFTNQPVNFIIGVLADKAHEQMLEIMMPYANHIYTITPPNPRGLSGEVLADEVRKWNTNVTACESIAAAVDVAISQSEKDGCPIIAFGSLSYLGQLKETYKQIRESRMENV